jgi:hypothetical protein
VQGLGWALALALALALPAHSATLTLQPGGPPLAELLRRAAEGDVIEVLPGEYSGQVGVAQGKKRVTLRGIGSPRPVLRADGRSAEGKGILVVRDSEMTVENLEFRGARVPDRNGAGVRFDSGRLTVRNCRFADNENGLLAGNDAASTLEVIDSEFVQAPAGTPLPHLIYVGRIARFTLRGSRVAGGQEGHLVKTRAAHNQVLYNELVDGAGGRASYELEFPNGGIAVVLGNVIGQSDTTTNAVLVAYGTEGLGPGGREHGLYMAHNTLVNGGAKPAWFVRVLGEGVEQQLFNNLFAGLGISSLKARELLLPAAGNWFVPRALLRDADTGAYGLGPDSWLRGWAVAMPALPGRSLVPDAQFTPPLGTRPLAPNRPLSPGAVQD